MRRLVLTTAGESHGPGLTAILQGLPAGLRVDFDFLARELHRRQHGHGRGRRMQIESDAVEVRGGVRGGETLGSPVALWIENRDYANWEKVMNAQAVDPRAAELRRLKAPRPGHVDLAGGIKYDRRDLRDLLERASARETAARVAAGAFAKLLLREVGVEIRSGVRSLGPVGAGRPAPSWPELLRVGEDSPLRAIDRELEAEMVALVDRAKEAGDTLGGAVTVIAHGVPAGLGSHVHWDEKLDGRLMHAIASIPAVKAVEIGDALRASAGFGSAAHDPILYETADELPAGAAGGRWRRPSNHAGGLEAGITNGEDLVLTAYMKPISTLLKGLPSVDLDTLEPHRAQYERSDVTALPACGVVAEAMVALVVADALLEKVGGDSMTELRRHLEATLELQRSWPGSPVVPVE
ncbi:MAG TPA: chorismate synthase [Thermoanaerobaculia bacterium]|jgi:chorismate synthase|nr:chorismate synthase [Thermoanaerobaculia bacterium]